jgi:S-methylmethionine-dependent homocysteine/selenocysteine methylase
MLFQQCISDVPLILTECAITERLRRIPQINLHPLLFISPLIYEEAGRSELEKIYFSYRKVARQAQLPILLCAPTWRLDQEQTSLAEASPSINADAVAFINGLAKAWQHPLSPVITGALLAPKNDCYSPQAGLSRTESTRFHCWQIQQLVDTGISVITAQTMPTVEEALGMADILSTSQTPYIISFVIGDDGKILDGTPLWQGIQIIDNEVARPPAGYMIAGRDTTRRTFSASSWYPGKCLIQKSPTTGWLFNTAAKSPGRLGGKHAPSPQKLRP